MGALERGERNLSFHNLVLVSKVWGSRSPSCFRGAEARVQNSGRPSLPSGSVVPGSQSL
jgi:hypothetical protein